MGLLLLGMEDSKHGGFETDDPQIHAIRRCRTKPLSAAYMPSPGGRDARYGISAFTVYQRSTGLLTRVRARAFTCRYACGEARRPWDQSWKPGDANW